MSARWKKLKDPPIGNFERLLHLNKHEFIVVPSDATETDGIYKYNGILNEWTKIIDYPKDYESMGQFPTIDQDNRIIYICCTDSKLLGINLNTKSIQTIVEQYDLGIDSGIMFANNTIHVIGGNENDKHLIFDNDNKEFKEFHDFASDKQIPCSYALYLPSRKTIINTIYHRNNPKIPVSVVEFKNNKWTNLNIANCEDIFGAYITATSHEDYLIFLCGFDLTTEDLNLHRWIYVLDMKTYKLVQSKIQVPEAGENSSGITTRNEEQEDLVTFGFVHECYKTEIFQKVQMIPFDLINVLKRWVCYETFHLVLRSEQDIEKCEHLTIDVDEIIKTALQRHDK